MGGKGKKTAAPAAAPAAAPQEVVAPVISKKPSDPDEEVFRQRARELHTEGNKAYHSRDIRSALQLYEQALNLTPKSDVDERVALHNNRAAAFLMLQQYVDVVGECTTVLNIIPEHPKALLRRAKAYDGSGHYQKALRDLEALEATGADCGEDISSLKERVKTLSDPAVAAKNAAASAAQLAAKQSAAAAAAAAAPAASSSEVAAQANGSQVAHQQPRSHWAKLILGDDIRVALVPITTLADLKEVVGRRFPEEIKYQQMTVSVPDAAAEGEARFKEITTDEEMVASLTAAVEAGKAARFKLERPLHPLPVNGELDEWILDFASIFREQLGVDAEAHLDTYQEALDQCAEALEGHVSLEKARELLAQAGGKFQEAAALALFNWGNVEMCQARKRMEGPKAAPGASDEEKKKAAAAAAEFRLAAEPAKEALALLDSAEPRYKAALEVKADFHDASIALAQHKYERARYLTLTNGPEKEVHRLFEESDAAFKRVLAVLPAEPAQPAEPLPPGVEPEPSTRAQVQVMHGNVLFEHSQVCARGGKEWKKLLDQAVALFTEAGCSKEDIQGALEQHVGKQKEAA